MDTRKPTPKKKAAPKKEKRDFSQVALSIVEQVIGKPLASAKKKR